MNRVEATVRKVDRFQQRNRVGGFLFGVVKKYGDDRGGQLAALLTYYGFLSLFPLLLLLVTILGIVAGSSSSITKTIEHSALAQFPVIGSTDKPDSLEKNIQALHANSVIGLAIGLLGLIWGAQGAAQTGLHAMAEVWNVPGVQRPGFFPRLVRALAFMGVLGVFLIMSSTLTAITSWGSHSVLVRIGGIVGAFVVNAVAFLLAFRVLTPKQIPSPKLVPGALIGSFAWTIVQNIGTQLVEHQLRHSSQVYGVFAIVLGLIAWIYLGANITIYAAESNVAWDRRLWPRSIVQPPLTRADEEVLAAIAEQGRRRPEQAVSVRFQQDDEVASGDPVPEPGVPRTGPG